MAVDERTCTAIASTGHGGPTPQKVLHHVVMRGVLVSHERTRC